jgi:sporulation protein YlmC with PRC-barrel domain
MKTKLHCAAVLAVLGMAAVSVSGQTQTTTTTSTQYMEASKLIGTKVKVSQGEEVGEIKDVVLDNNGCMAYTVVNTVGGGAAGKTVAVPWSVYSVTSDPSVLTVSVDRERIYNAPVFEYSRIHEYSNPAWISQVDSYYGVSGRSGVSTTGSVSGNVRNTEQTNRATGYGAASTAAASPAPNSSASPRGTAKEARASESPGSSPEASTSPTRKTARHESHNKARSSVTPSSRHENENATGERTRESGEETTGNSSSSETKSRRHTTEERTRTQPSASSEATPERE